MSITNCMWLLRTDNVACDHHRTMFECMDQNPESVPGSIADTNGVLFYYTEVKCNYGIPCPPYDAQKEVTCSVHKVMMFYTMDL